MRYPRHTTKHKKDQTVGHEAEMFPMLKKGRHGWKEGRMDQRKDRCGRYPCQRIVTPERILLVHVIKSEVKSFSDVTIVKHALLLGEEESKQVASIHDDHRLKGNHGSLSPAINGLFVEQKEEKF